MRTLLRLLPYFKDYRWLMLASYIAVIGNAFFNLAVPRLIGIAVDNGVAKQDVSQLVLLSVGIVVASGLRGLCAFGQNYLGETAAQGGSYQLRRALYVHILRGDAYEQVESSEQLPGIDLALLVSFLDHPTAMQAVRAYRDALRAAAK